VQNHAANLAVLANGDLACVWFGGTQEGLPDTNIYLSRLDSDRDTWGEPQELSNDPDQSEQNPVLFSAPDGQLWLFYTAQTLGQQDTAVVRVRTSSDGQTLTDPTPLLPHDIVDGGQFIRHPPVVTSDGTWLLPMFVCRADADGSWSGDRDTSVVLASHDHGQTWTPHDVPGTTGLVHMNVVTMTDGSLVAFFRSRWADNVYRSHSSDGGRTWTPAEPTSLPNNNSSIQAIRLLDGRLALVFNNVRATHDSPRRSSLYDEIDDPPRQRAAHADGHSAVWGTPRAPLSLAWSPDGGLSWPDVSNLELGDGNCLTNNSRDGLNRELSYPSIVQTADETIHVAFTYHRRYIKYIRLSPGWALGGHATSTS
jgi:predicted neuraminidase